MALLLYGPRGGPYSSKSFSKLLPHRTPFILYGSISNYSTAHSLRIAPYENNFCKRTGPSPKTGNRVGQFITIKSKFMKRFIMPGLLVLAIVTAFAFTSRREQSSLTREQTAAATAAFQRYYCTISQVLPVPGTPCVELVTLSFSFTWNGPGTPFSPPAVSGPPTSQLFCPNSYAKPVQSSITTFDVDIYTGRCTNIAFAPTGNAAVDARFSSQAFLDGLIAEINTQIENQ